MPASADTGLTFALAWLETLRNFLRLLEVFGRGAPEEQASGHFSDRQRYPEFCGHAEEAVFHRGGAGTFRERHVGGGVVQRLELLPEGMIEQEVHTRPAAHTAGMVERHIFEFDGGALLCHRVSRVLVGVSGRWHIRQRL
jgi:hypothetical protein